ncbi:MAG: TIGR02186 family protein, partial [Candidatus Puniceispirillaceae bacterium]
MIRPLLIFFIWLSVSTSPALSRQLVADLSSDEVSITTDFTGQNLLLFGAVSNVDTTAIAGRESDIIVILTGPTLPLSSRKKERVSGIWINTQTVQWRNAPSFYHILSSRPLSQILSDDKLKELRIGYQHLGLKSKKPDDTPQKIADWQESLSRNMTAQNLWRVDEQAVS